MYIVSEEFIYYTSNFNDWNYNKMIETPDINPFDSDKKLNECNCNSYEYKCLIFLDVIITYTREYLENDVKEWILKNV